MRSFEFTAKPGRVVFGAGSRAWLADEIDRLGAERALIVTTAGRAAIARDLAETLGDGCVGVIDDARPHVPIEQAAAARARARELKADAVIAIGGGSPIGLAKGIALEVDVRLLALPTTYAGSEMTAIVGVTHDGVKRTVGHPRILPQVVIYDPELTVGLSPHATATTGMNAMAHCVEALYAQSPNPVSSLTAAAGIEALARALPRAVKAPGDLDARTEALYGAYLAGFALGHAGIAMHHRICHVLGGSYGIGHGDANAVMLPHVIRYNESVAPDAIATVAAGLGRDDAAGAMYDLVDSIGAPTGLKTLGLDEADLPAIAQQSVASISYNPRPVDAAGLLPLLANAFHGHRP